jgi:hypothetical protein
MFLIGMRVGVVLVLKTAELGGHLFTATEFPHPPLLGSRKYSILLNPQEGDYMTMISNTGWAASFMFLAFIAALPAGASDQACPHSGPVAGKGVVLAAPQSLNSDHDALHERLKASIDAGGAIGAAAKAVADVLHPHFVREEKLAMPLLGILGKVVAHTATEAELAEARKISEEFRAEHPKMLKEHEAIKAALENLKVAAERDKKPEFAAVAEFIKNHAKVEEEVLYPSALLLGLYLEKTETTGRK